MKKTISIICGCLFLIGCTKDDIFLEPIPPSLTINNKVGIKLETSFVTNEVKMNVKTDASGTVTIKIFDIANRVVSKEITEVKTGDNLLTVYTNALPNSAYRIGLFDSNGNQLGITDFNKTQN